MRLFSGIITLVLLTSAPTCGKSKTTGDVAESVRFAQGAPLDLKAIERDLREISKEPHPFGSARQREVGDYLLRRAKELGLESWSVPFKAATPNSSSLAPMSMAPRTLERSGVNVLAWAGSAKAPCVVMLGSHYDSKHIEGAPYRGANDSGSSSAALLHIMANLAKTDADCAFLGVWFDGEEPVLADWNDGELMHPARIQDNTYGSRFMADRLVSCEGVACFAGKNKNYPVRTLILLDMIGPRNVTLTRDANSHPTLLNLAIHIADELGDMDLFSNRPPTPIEDDHIPFKRRGIPVIDLIDFHNLEFWHKPGDDVDKVDLGSVAKVAKLAMALAKHAAQNKDLKF
jgi:hypothetical protein